MATNQALKMNSVSPLQNSNVETQPFRTEVDDTYAEPQIELVKPAQEQKRNTWKRLIYDFATSTSAHGIGRIAAAETYIRRGMWVLICLGFYTALFWFCIVLVIKYTKKPVSTKVEIAFEESMDFPSITFCNMNALKRGNLHRIKEMETLMDRFKPEPPKPIQGNKFERSFNVTKQAAKNRDLLLARARSEKQREFYSGFEVDDNDAQKQLLDRMIKGIPTQTLSEYGHTFEDMVKRCRWSSYRCDRGTLRKLWKHFWHWRFGNCYTFNSGRSESGQKQEVLTTDDPGPNNGMQLDIFVDQSQYTSNTEEAGIRVVINDQGIMPFPAEQGFSIATGFSTTVGIRRMRLKRVDPFQNRSCSDSTDEASTTESDNTTGGSNLYEHMYHVRYSPETCRKSCLAEKQQKLCNCTESQFPVANSSACSTTEQSICTRNVSRTYMKKGGLCSKQCPLPCRDNFLRLNVFYEDFSVEKVIYEENYTLVNLLADIGGQLGLWVGVSVLTVTELLELISSLFYLGVKKICTTSRKE